MNRHTIKAILFDYDDTLVKSRESVWQAHKQTAKTYYDFELTDEMIGRHWGKPYPEMLVGVYRNLEPYDQIHQKYMAVRVNFPMKAHDESVGVLNQLLDNYTVGIVTAANRQLIELDLQRLNFPVERMALIQTADDTTVHKPDPKVFDQALKKLAKKRIKPTEVLYVGDDLSDYQAASGAGLQFVGIVRNGINPFENYQIKIINSLKKLVEIHD
ncbi:hypothetical protein A2W24_01670 [Microgenomates group bacterium RBG_16_45_19]|nr:MAG: hypothetical protein A2W24_01670 [Microgenomates group bacterium RBG_16_45_19]